MAHWTGGSSTRPSTMRRSRDAPSWSRDVGTAWRRHIPPRNAHTLRRRQPEAPMAARPALYRGRRDRLADQPRQLISADCTTLPGDRGAASPSAATHICARDAGVLIRWPSVAKGLASSQQQSPRAANRPPPTGNRWLDAAYHLSRRGYDAAGQN